jgi:1-acyl-sn-glycerol-3-phosphate acyltransferase
VRRLLERPGRLDVTLRFLEPFDPSLYPDRKQLAGVTREKIAASIAMHLPPFAPATAPV